MRHILPLILSFFIGKTGAESFLKCEKALSTPLSKKALSHNELPEGFSLIVYTPRLIIGSFSKSPSTISVLERLTFKKIGNMAFEVNVSDRSANIPLDSFFVKRKGFATEAKWALMKYAFEILEIEKIEAFINTDNIPSQRLHLKLGFQYIDSVNHQWRYQLNKKDFEDYQKYLSDRYADTFELFYTPQNL